MSKPPPPVDAFDFKEARNRAVFICKRVSEGAPILWVTHDSDGEWQFLCGGDDHQGEDQPLIVCLEHVIERNPPLNELAGMSTNHHAERDSLNLPWRIIDDSEAFIEERVREGGWSVEVIPAGEGKNEPAFAYTIGLFENFKHAELIVFGQRHETMGFILNELGDRIRSGKPLAPGDRISGCLEGYDVLIREVKEKKSYKEHVGYARWFYKGSHFPLFQVVWPDLQGHFPGEAGVAEILESQQPLLP